MVSANNCKRSFRTKITDTALQKQTTETKLKANKTETKIKANKPETKLKNNKSETKIKNNKAETKIKANKPETKLKDNKAETKLKNNKAEKLSSPKHHNDAKSNHFKKEDKEKLKPTTPPFVGAKGEWVLRSNFRKDEKITVKEKKLGLFVCKCGNHWYSGHARLKKFRQGCKKCETKWFALYVWKYDEKINQKGGIKKKGPHDETRCEACLAGDYCTRTSST